MGVTGVTRLTPVPPVSLVYVEKTTTTGSISDGEIIKISSNKAVKVATVTDGTTTNLLGVSESRSANGNANGVMVRLANEGVDYLVGLNTATTVSINTPLMLVSGQSKQVAKSSTVTDKRVGFCVLAESAATSVRMRFFNPTHTK
jgi:hypothetical protein